MATGYQVPTHAFIGMPENHSTARSHNEQRAYIGKAPKACHETTDK